MYRKSWSLSVRRAVSSSDRPRRDRGDRNGRDRRPRRPREDRPITPSVPKERELIPVSEAGMQQAEKLATDFVTGLLAKMGVEGQVKTLPQVECDQLRLEISGPDMGSIIAAAATRWMPSSTSALWC